MAGSLNKVLLIGRLGADPEIKQMVNGKSVARFSLATSNTWKDKNTGEKKEKTEWHRVVIFNEGLVKVVQQYVKKGTKLYLEGRLQTRSYEQDGVKKYSTEIVANEMQMLDSRGAAGTNQEFGDQPNVPSSPPQESTQNSEQQASANFDNFDDDIPF